MKRLIALLLALVTVLSLAACAGNENTDTDTTTAPTTASGGEKQEIVIDSDDPLYTKTSYSVSDDALAAAREVIVATTGDANLTVAELQVYYWMSVRGFLSNYSYYLTYFGLDYSAPLDEQKCSEIDGTWQHYFLNDALSSWHNYQALSLMAKEENVAMNVILEKELQDLRADLEKEAEESKFESVDAMLQAEICPGITYEDYVSYLTTYYNGYSYFQNKLDAKEVTNDEIEDYFDKHKDELAENKITKESGNVVDVRHVLIVPKGGTKDDSGNTTYSDAEWDACKAEAEKLLQEWKDGKADEDSFAEMANKHSEDPGSNTTGGLYQHVYKGQMVEPFENWCFDESRQTGDTGIVKTDYGYHIMYFISEEPQWVYYCREEIISEWAQELVATVAGKYLMTVNYEDIVLGVVDLTAGSSSTEE